MEMGKAETAADWRRGLSEIVMEGGESRDCAVSFSSSGCCARCSQLVGLKGTGKLAGFGYV